MYFNCKVSAAVRVVGASEKLPADMGQETFKAVAYFEVTKIFVSFP